MTITTRAMVSTSVNSTSATEVLGFLRRSVDEFSQTVVMVTHDAHAASYADRAVFLSDGHIVHEMRGATQEDLVDRWLFAGNRPLVRSVRVGGRDCGEPEIFAIRAGELGVPVGLVSGDQVAIEQLRARDAEVGISGSLVRTSVARIVSDVATAYQDVVARFLGEDRPLRFVSYEKPGLLKRLFGGK